MKLKFTFFLLSFVFALSVTELSAQNIQQLKSTCTIIIDDSRNPNLAKEDLRLQFEKINAVKSCAYDVATKTYVMQVYKEFKEVDAMKMAQKNKMGIVKVETKF